MALIELRQSGGCGCCGPADRSTGAASGAGADEDGSTTRIRFVAGAEQLGIAGDDLAALVTLFHRGDCAAVRRHMAQLVQARLAAAELRVVEQIEQAARVQAGAGGLGPGSGPADAGLPGAVTELTALVARLQGAAHRLAQPTGSGACDADCPCVTAASAVSSPRIPASRAALSGSELNGPDLVCTIEGGIDAMRARITEWQAVLGRATGREPADGGVVLSFSHDPAVTVELARLAAAEYACCSFFTFTLIVGPDGVRFTVTAPPDAQDVVTALFGGRAEAGLPLGTRGKAAA
ncbi:hypothetical protein EV385_1116 [Krasilnikovia cinnamomea]|uniref:Uncharacterized protein n=1 Tax=Krasilnikovia cinnamomea TaxID=349313 RepID=A0A4V2G6N4_9ACTN|nr:hypothetical protein [Krasilnikovia cinnamomea]RZU49366.1 hypothetical protein EV385_1116 [Krasilnikovia cinnamomea]